MRIDIRCLVAAVAVVVAASPAAVATIYGTDDRMDLYQVSDPQLLSLADSTVALFNGFALSADSSGRNVTLPSIPFGKAKTMCKDERFIDQPVGSWCSGLLVAPDMILTAGHCVNSQEDCAGIKFVFGFDVKQKGVNPTSVPAGEVYGCKELIGREQHGDGADWALVRLDKTVQNHKALAVDRSGKISNGTPLVLIGYPEGLPAKIAGNAKVRDASPGGYFTANTDSFTGDSGGPVFDATTGLVVGILVHGDEDFVVNNGECHNSYRCSDDGCEGEHVMKLSTLFDKIPAGAGKLQAKLHSFDSSTLQTLLKAADKNDAESETAAP